MAIYNQILSKKYPLVDFSSYSSFIEEHKKDIFDSTSMDAHHVLLKSIFPEYKNLKNHSWNRANLLHKDHLKAHIIFYDLTRDYRAAYAVQMMLDVFSNASFDDTFFEEYQLSIESARQTARDTITVKDLEIGQIMVIDRDVYKNNRHRYQHINAGKVSCRNVTTGKVAQIDKELFDTDENFVGVMDGLCTVKDIETGQIMVIDKDVYNNNRHMYQHISAGKVTCKNVITEEVAQIDKEIFDADENFVGIMDSLCVVKDLETGQTVTIDVNTYDNNRHRYQHINAGKVVCKNIVTGEVAQIDKEVFNTDENFVSVMMGMCIAKNIQTGESEFVSVEEFQTRNDLVGHAKGKINCIDAVINKIVTIPLADFYSDEKYVSRMKNKVPALNKETNEISHVTLDEFYSNENLIHPTTGTVTVFDTVTHQTKRIKSEDYHSDANTRYISVSKNKVNVYDNVLLKNVSISTEEYHNNRKRYISFCEGEVNVVDTTTGKKMRISIDEFQSSNRYVSISKGLTPALDVTTGETKLVPVDVFNANDNLIHPTTGTVAVKLKGTNDKYKRIPASEYHNNKDLYDISTLMKKGTMYVKDTHTNKSILITADEYNKNKHLYIHPGESTVEYKTVTCPHCGKSGKENAMMRWHFDNCSKIKSPEILTCPHCGISKRKSGAFMYHHFDNCKMQ